MRKFFLFVFIFLLAIETCNAQIFHKKGSVRAEKALFRKSSGSKKIKVKEPRVVLKAKKKQEANDKKLKKEYAQSVKRSRGRSIKIQSPEVQARMKQNRKDSSAQSKIKKKKVRASSKKAGKKYK
ncbi:MAG TPA: hypothetical protein VMV77_16150 [Bacteroidales bacterium]|nr:hypothetical protein [Bacteroidales bacterium]